VRCSFRTDVLSFLTRASILKSCIGRSFQFLWKPLGQVSHYLYFLNMLITTCPGAPSLFICTNAARSCVRIFNTHERRGIPFNYNMLVRSISLQGSLSLTRFRCISACSICSWNHASSKCMERHQIRFCIQSIQRTGPSLFVSQNNDGD
jgi:hypothetical protein